MLKIIGMPGVAIAIWLVQSGNCLVQAQDISNVPSIERVQRPLVLKPLILQEKQRPIQRIRRPVPCPLVDTDGLGHCLLRPLDPTKP